MARDGLYKRGKIWWVRTDPIDRLPRSTGCRDLEAARLWRAQRERASADPSYAAAQAAHVGEWCGRYIRSMTRQSSETVREATQKLGHWVRIFGAEAPLAVLDPGAFDRFVGERREESVTDHTISKEVTRMIAVLKLAKRAGCYPGDLDALRPPDLHTGYQPRKRALNRAELAALLAELEPQRGALVAVCVALGCRLGEANRLLPTDVDLDRGEVFIRGTKTAGARRTVPILSLYRPLLARAMGYLPIASWDNVRRDLGRACTRAGIDRVTPNDLRRTHATLLVEAGVDRDVVRRLLGHTTSAMVERVYGQPSLEALRNLAEERLGDGEGLAPVTNPLQLRGHESEIYQKHGANLGIRTPDLRFTNPRQDSGHKAIPAENPAETDSERPEQTSAVTLAHTITRQSISRELLGLAMAAASFGVTDETPSDSRERPALYPGVLDAGDDELPREQHTPEVRGSSLESPSGGSRSYGRQRARQGAAVTAPAPESTGGSRNQLTATAGRPDDARETQRDRYNESTGTAKSPRALAPAATTGTVTLALSKPDQAGAGPAGGSTRREPGLREQSGAASAAGTGTPAAQRGSRGSSHAKGPATDLIGELCEIVRSAGAVMTLYGRPVSEDELRGHLHAAVALKYGVGGLGSLPAVVRVALFKRRDAA